MMRKYLVWLIAGPIIVALAFLGWQYMRNRSLNQSVKKLVARSGLQPYLAPDETNKLDPEVVKRQTLAEAIKHFRSAKSMRISLTQPTKDGPLTGQLDYVRPLRLHAVLNTPDKKILDLIIIGETVYIRTGENSWEMSNDAFAKDYGRSFFTSMLIADDTPASFGIADDASITTQKDSTKKCSIYKTQYKSADNQFFDMRFCLNDQKDIVYMKTQTKDGEVTSEYKDYNALFLIERPRMPLLTPNPSPGANSTSSTS